jgi:hypothetical protein
MPNGMAVIGVVPFARAYCHGHRIFCAADKNHPCRGRRKFSVGFAGQLSDEVDLALTAGHSCGKTRGATRP